MTGSSFRRRNTGPVSTVSTVIVEDDDNPDLDTLSAHDPLGQEPLNALEMASLEPRNGGAKDSVLDVRMRPARKR